MSKWYIRGGLIMLALMLVGGIVSMSGRADEKKAGPKLAHMVYFGLKDNSKEGRDKFIASCQKYLTNHPGTVHFGIGVIADDVEEPGISARDFDVALVIVFENKAAKDQYHGSDRHKQFGAENGSNFAKVRVYDSYLIDP